MNPYNNRPLHAEWTLGGGMGAGGSVKDFYNTNNQEQDAPPNPTSSKKEPQV